MAAISAKATARRLRRGGPTFLGRSRAVSSEQKAIWHQMTGAGKSQVRREFLGASDEDEREIFGVLERLIAERTGATQHGA